MVSCLVVVRFFWLCFLNYKTLKLRLNRNTMVKCWKHKLIILNLTCSLDDLLILQDSQNFSEILKGKNCTVLHRMPTQGGNGPLYKFTIGLIDISHNMSLTAKAIITYLMVKRTHMYHLGTKLWKDFVVSKATWIVLELLGISCISVWLLTKTSQGAAQEMQILSFYI